MDLDQQLRQLIEDAPEERGMPVVMERAIAPTLKLLAHQLQHQEYYILQSSEENWQVTTLRHRENQNLEKRVIYAFPSLEDAEAFAQHNDPQLMALPIPVTHILFELLALEQVDTLIFFDESGNYDNGTEIARKNLHKLIQEQLKKLKEKSEQPPTNFA